MKKERFGTAECCGEPVYYYLLSAGDSYGIGVEYRGEAVQLCSLGNVRASVEDLLAAMALGGVTPVTAGDVAEDWLLAGNP